MSCLAIFLCFYIFTLLWLNLLFGTWERLRRLAFLHTRGRLTQGILSLGRPCSICSVSTKVPALYITSLCIFILWLEVCSSWSPSPISLISQISSKLEILNFKYVNTFLQLDIEINWIFYITFVACRIDYSSIYSTIIFVCSRGFVVVVDSFWFSTQLCHLPTDDNFPCFPASVYTFISFSCLIPIARTSPTTLNRIDCRGHPCLVLKLRKRIILIVSLR